MAVTAIALFTRDLRVHDNPMLVAAAEADLVVPVFVVDPGVRAVGDVGPNRAGFLRESLLDLHAALVDRGAGLLVRRGDPSVEVDALLTATGATEVHVADDVTRFADRRLAGLRDVASRRGAVVHAWPGTTVVEPSAVRPSGGVSAYQVFTPYWRRWTDEPLRPLVGPPRALRLPGVVAGDPGLGAVPTTDELTNGDEVSPQRVLGGERRARARLDAWLEASDPAVDEGWRPGDLPADGSGSGSGQLDLLAPPPTASEGPPTGAAPRWGLDRYAAPPTDAAGGVDGHDNLAVDGTSGLSADLHLGTLSPREVVARVGGDRVGGDRPARTAFVRQLCWRDFHHQVTAWHGDVRGTAVRPRGDEWRDVDGEAAQDLAAWCAGRTGLPLVDAGMRQLRATGWMHNRARMVVASVLTKNLRIDWRVGERHFMRWLVDGDVANNALNWQWVAGTGLDSRPSRVLSPLRQAERFDPTGAYVHRWVPELRHLRGRALREPHDVGRVSPDDYPTPIVDYTSSRAAFLRARGA